MEKELDFAEIFGDLPQVLFPYDKSLPVKRWMVQGPAQQLAFWHSEDAYESAEHSHPYSEWGVVITGWCDISTPESMRRCNAGDAFHLEPSVPHASVTSANYRSMDVFFSPNHLKAEPAQDA